MFILLCLDCKSQEGCKRCSLAEADMGKQGKEAKKKKNKDKTFMHTQKQLFSLSLAGKTRPANELKFYRFSRRLLKNNQICQPSYVWENWLICCIFSNQLPHYSLSNLQENTTASYSYTLQSCQEAKHRQALMRTADIPVHRGTQQCFCQWTGVGWPLPACWLWLLVDGGYGRNTGCNEWFVSSPLFLSAKQNGQEMACSVWQWQSSLPLH